MRRWCVSLHIQQNISCYFLLSPGRAPHLMSTQLSGMAVNVGFFCWLRLVVWRCGEQPGWDMCGQDTSPSAGSVLCHCHIWAGPGGSCHSWDLCQLLHALETDPACPGILSGDIFNTWGRICAFLCVEGAISGNTKGGWSQRQEKKINPTVISMFPVL